MKHWSSSNKIEGEIKNEQEEKIKDTVGFK